MATQDRNAGANFSDDERHFFFFSVGFDCDPRRNHRSPENPRKMVPGPIRLLVQFSSHYARAGGSGCRPDALRRQNGSSLVDEPSVPGLSQLFGCTTDFAVGNGS